MRTVSVVRVGLAIQPVIDLMRDALLEADLIYGDETTFQVLKKPGRQPPTKSYVWAQMNGCGPPIRLFTYTPGRGAKHAAQLYAGVKPGTALMTVGTRCIAASRTTINSFTDECKPLLSGRNLQGWWHRSISLPQWLFQRLPLAQTADDYAGLLPSNMSAELR
ncbi:hypothetical protein LMG28727_07457 [Paraburkholderia kirstenboschensis]|nr:hypothetical protein LMG28727_07457 [Paraburkholderia kirstenboschensis]